MTTSRLPFTLPSIHAPGLEERTQPGKKGRWRERGTDRILSLYLLHLFLLLFFQKHKHLPVESRLNLSPGQSIILRVSQ